jgi:two-component system alkaline phosphatase synthesis response regulator PhoP
MNDFGVSSGFSSRRVLVVDDTTDVAEFLQAMLLHLGHQVELARDGKAALRGFEAAKYDLVITDYLMPEMNGVELARAMKQLKPGQLILMMTGSSLPLATRVEPGLCADFILRKPFSITEFQGALESLFRMDESTT